MPSRSTTPLEIGIALGRRREEAPVAQVLADGQVRKQPRVLEHIADPAPVLRHEDPRRSVSTSTRPSTAIRPSSGRLEPADQVDQRGLARAGRPEERGQPAGALEGGVEREGAEPVADLDRQRHSMSMRRLIRRAKTSEATSATMAMAIETSVSRSAPASPPGTWVKV